MLQGLTDGGLVVRSKPDGECGLLNEPEVGKAWLAHAFSRMVEAIYSSELRASRPILGQGHFV